MSKKNNPDSPAFPDYPALPGEPPENRKPSSLSDQRVSSLKKRRLPTPLRRRKRYGSPHRARKDVQSFKKSPSPTGEGWGEAQWPLNAENPLVFWTKGFLL